MIINDYRIIDLRLRERVRTFIWIIIIFLAFAPREKDYFGLLLLHWIFIDPFLSTYGVICPFCSKNFFKIRKFVLPMWVEKERTKCFHCEQSPIIVSDKLITDNIQAALSSPICDFRDSEKQILSQHIGSFFLISLFTVLAYCILLFVFKIEDDFSTYLWTPIAIIFLIQYRKFMIALNKFKCSQCSSNYLIPSFNIFNAFKQIKKCECNSCGNKIFTRSFYVTTDFIPFVKQEKEEKIAADF